jgi:hypothetical protein
LARVLEQIPLNWNHNRSSPRKRGPSVSRATQAALDSRLRGNERKDRSATDGVSNKPRLILLNHPANPIGAKGHRDEPWEYGHKAADSINRRRLQISVMWMTGGITVAARTTLRGPRDASGCIVRRHLRARCGSVKQVAHRFRVRRHRAGAVRNGTDRAMGAKQHGGGEEHEQHGGGNHQSKRIGALVLLPQRGGRPPRGSISAGLFRRAVTALRFPCQVPAHVLVQVAAQVVAQIVGQTVGRVVAQAFAGGKPPSNSRKSCAPYKKYLRIESKLNFILAGDSAKLLQRGSFSAQGCDREVK